MFARLSSLASVAIALVCLPTPAWAHEGPLPAPWHLSRNFPTDDYTAGTTDSDAHSGTSCGYVKCGLGTPRGWGDVNQGFKATHYRGKRIRYSVWVKAIDVKKQGSVWLRVDSGSEQYLSFHRKDFSGTSGWKRYELISDVPVQAQTIAIGVDLQGQGAICFDDIKVEAIGAAAPGPRPLSTPANLGFER